MKKVLFVDDDPLVLAALQRQLRRELEVETAISPEQGLTALESGDAFAVVVTDLRMPGMDGLEFLRRVRDRAPEVVRIMLTGNANRETAIHAINEGSVFRFLLKPCPTDEILAAIRAALRQNERLVIEREMLEKTVRGCVDTLTDILSLAAPEVFNRSRRLRDDSLKLARRLELTRVWELEVAALLCRIATVALPPDLLQRTEAGAPLSETESEMLGKVPEMGSRLLAHIPRMESICRTIRHHEQRFDGSGCTAGGVAGTRIPVHARILKVVGDLQELLRANPSVPAAFDVLHQRVGWYDPEILAAAGRCFVAVEAESPRAPVRKSLRASELTPGLRLTADVRTRSGMLIAPAGTEIRAPLLHCLQNFSALGNLVEPVEVLEPFPEIRTD